MHLFCIVHYLSPSLAVTNRSNVNYEPSKIFLFLCQGWRKQIVSGLAKKHICTYGGVLLEVTTQLECAKHTPECKAWAF